MLRILIIFLVLVAGITVGPMFADYQGIVIFQASGYRITMSLKIFALALVCLLLSLSIIYFLLKKIFYSKTAFGSWLRSKSPKKVMKQIEQAQLCLLEGDYKKASKLLSKSAKKTENSALTYLQAAQAEINNNQFDIAREHLDIAAKTCQENEKFAFKLVQLRLHIKTKQYDLAQHSVENLLDEKPRNPEVLRLADELYYEIKSYQSIIDILPSMYKSGAFNEAQLDQFKNVAYIGRIKQLVDTNGVEKMMLWWKDQPKAIRNTAIYKDAVAIYHNNLLEHNKD